MEEQKKQKQREMMYGLIDDLEQSFFETYIDHDEAWEAYHNNDHSYIALLNVLEEKKEYFDDKEEYFKEVMEMFLGKAEEPAFTCDHCGTNGYAEELTEGIEDCNNIYLHDVCVDKWEVKHGRIFERRDESAEEAA